MAGVILWGGGIFVALCLMSRIEWQYKRTQRRVEMTPPAHRKGWEQLFVSKHAKFAESHWEHQGTEWTPELAQSWHKSGQPWYMRGPK